MILNLINQKDFKVARVISFRDDFIGRSGTVCYLRPYNSTYNKKSLDDFDRSFIEWLNVLNLSDVKKIYSEDILFDHQISQIIKIYNGGRPSSKLSFTCHGDYLPEDIISMGKIDAICLELNIYWNANKEETFPLLGGTMTFDQRKKDYYFDVIKKITSI